jgi:hypothetical protein
MQSLELEQQFAIPTASKAKIPHKLSYPIGAESISIALASVPQLKEIRLHFYWWSQADWRRGHDEFLRVEYLNNVPPLEKWPIWIPFRRPAQGRWEIVVQPVPRTVRHRVKQYIADFALAQMSHWLTARKELRQQGGDILAFYYDEKSDDFVVRQLTRLEPVR